MLTTHKLDDFLFHEIVEFAQNFQPAKRGVSFTSDSLQVKVDRTNGTIQVTEIEDKDRNE